MTSTSNLVPAQVIHHDNDHVWTMLGFSTRTARDRHQQRNERSKEPHDLSNVQDGFPADTQSVKHRTHGADLVIPPIMDDFGAACASEADIRQPASDTRNSFTNGQSPAQTHRFPIRWPSFQAARALAQVISVRNRMVAGLPRSLPPA